MSDTATLEHLQERIRDLSTNELAAVNEFITFLRAGDRTKLDLMEGFLLSESVLRRELCNPEEDEAWRNLHVPTSCNA